MKIPCCFLLSVFVVCILGKPLVPAGRLQQERWYAADTAVASDGKPLSFEVDVDNPSTIESVRLVIGVHRAGGITEPLAVEMNGTPITVDAGDASEFTKFFAPFQIGRMAQALEQAGVRDNTIIIVWGDHGWHLGDMGVWGKATNYEIATRVPLMIWTPDMPAGNRGRSTDALVELVDMYPTLCELAGVPIPEHVEGRSFVPLLDDPGRPWKAAAFSQFPNPALREWAANPLSPGMRETWFGPLITEVESRIIAQQKEKWNRNLFENRLMGYTMRTDRYRLVVWKDTSHPDAEPIFVELYDHQEDPAETVNIAEKQPEAVAGLLDQFATGWQGAIPKVSEKEGTN